MKIYTVQELASATRTSSAQVRRWINDGLRALKVGKSYRISEKNFEEFMAKQGASPEPAAAAAAAAESLSW